MKTRAVAGVVLGIAFFALFAAAAVPGALEWPALAPDDPGVGMALWSGRTFEVLVQAVLLLAGVVAILLLLEASVDTEVSA